MNDITKCIRCKLRDVSEIGHLFDGTKEFLCDVCRADHLASFDDLPSVLDREPIVSRVTPRDLYEALNVDRKATTEQIRKAYRREAAKHHPDKGGDPAKWERIRLAHEVLADPKLRKIYDETGRIEEAKPDNDRAVALGVIESHIAAIMNKFLTDGMRPEFDPRKMDVPDVVAHRIRGEIREAKVGLTGGKKVVAFLKDMVDRFRPDPKSPISLDTCPIRRSFQSQVEANESQLRDLDKAIVVRELALKILAGYKFRQDERPASSDGADAFAFALRPAGFVSR